MIRDIYLWDQLFSNVKNLKIIFINTFHDEENSMELFRII